MFCSHGNYCRRFCHYSQEPRRGCFWREAFANMCASLGCGALHAKCTAGPDALGFSRVSWAWHWILQQPPLLKSPSLSSWYRSASPPNPTPATCRKRKRKLRCNFRNAALQKLHCNIKCYISFSRKRQFVHKMFVHNFLVPIKPRLPTSKVMDFLLNFF